MVTTGMKKIKSLYVSVFAASQCPLNVYQAGYSFFDTGEVELLGQRKRQPYANVGRFLGIILINKELKDL